PEDEAGAHHVPSNRRRAPVSVQLDLRCNKTTPVHHYWSEIGRCGVIADDPLLADHVSAVSEANDTPDPVSLKLRSSLSIQPSEGSRSRVRRTRSYLWNFNRFWPGKPCQKLDSEKMQLLMVIDVGMAALVRNSAHRNPRPNHSSSAQ